MRRSHFAACVAAAMAAAAFAAVPASAASAPRRDVREVPPDKKYSTAELGLRQQSAPRAAPRRAAAATPPVGTVRQWLALDDFNGILYRKDYTLRGVGTHIEVWVANDLAFPAGDCRTQIADSTEITDDAGPAPDHRVRRQHVPQGDDAPSARRLTATAPTPSSARTPTATAASTPAGATRPSR